MGSDKCDRNWGLGTAGDTVSIVPGANQTPMYKLKLRAEYYFTYDSILRGTTQKFQFIENVQENFENKEEITWKQQTNNLLQNFDNQSTLPPSNNQLDNQEINNNSNSNIFNFRLSIPQNLIPNLQENQNLAENSHNNQLKFNELNNFNNFMDYRLKLPFNKNYLPNEDMLPEKNKNF